MNQNSQQTLINVHLGTDDIYIYILTLDFLITILYISITVGESHLQGMCYNRAKSNARNAIQKR